jgi:hypothetical protein
VATLIRCAYGQGMPSTTLCTDRAVAARAQRRPHPVRIVVGLREPDRRFFGPQVPTENPVSWIAERAPPVSS